MFLNNNSNLSEQYCEFTTQRVLCRSAVLIFVAFLAAQPGVQKVSLQCRFDGHDLLLQLQVRSPQEVAECWQLSVMTLLNPEYPAASHRTVEGLLERKSSDATHSCLDV